MRHAWHDETISTSQCHIRSVRRRSNYRNYTDLFAKSEGKYNRILVVVIVVVIIWLALGGQVCTGTTGAQSRATEGRPPAPGFNIKLARLVFGTRATTVGGSDSS